MTLSDWGAALLAEVQLLKGSGTEAKYAEAHENMLRHMKKYYVIKPL